MKKLSKPPAREIIRYDKSTGFDFNYNFIFSEELPFKRKTRNDKYREGKLK